MENTPEQNMKPPAAAGGLKSLHRRHSSPQRDSTIQLNLTCLANDDRNKTCRRTKSQEALSKPPPKQRDQSRMEINFKNKNYCDSESTMGMIDELGCLKFGTDNSFQQQIEQKTHIQIGQRPITCPNSECKKMVAIESILLHFYFDHPKISRQFADVESHCVIPLKLSQLSAQSTCLSIIFPQASNQSKPTSPLDQKKIESYALLSGTYKDKSTLMLMGAIMSQGFFGQGDTLKGRDKTKSKRRNKSDIGSEAYENFKTKYDSVQKTHLQVIHPSDHLLIWICRLNDKVKYKYYKAILQRNDEKLAHSYVGETIHIRDRNDVKSIHERAECLMVNGVAVKKLFDEDEEIKLIINILDL